MRRLLITGASGFVGRYAVAEFGRRLASGDRLITFTNGEQLETSGVTENYSIDLCDAAAISALLSDLKPTHILHLAARSSVQQSADGPEQSWHTNLVGSLYLAQAIRRSAPASTLLFASSAEVYGRAFVGGQALDESAIPQPMNAYARTKFAAEMMLADVLADACRLIVVRAFNHTGAGQDERFVLPSFAGQISRIEAGNGEPVIEVGDLSAVRDFLDVRDVTSAYGDLLLAADTLPSRALLNLGSGIGRRIGEILNELSALARRPIEIRVAPDRLRTSEIAVACANSTQLRQLTGWRPTIPWRETLDALLTDARAKSSINQNTIAT